MKKHYYLSALQFCYIVFLAQAASAQVTDTSAWWACMKGKTTDQEFSTAGASGVFDINYRPGGRGGCATWVGKDNILWLFGGNGYTTGARGHANDLWKYDPATNMWAYVKGTNNNINTAATYGPQGTPGDSYTPGASEGAAYWTDKDGNLWLFGGARNGSYYSDLWKFDPVTNRWAWINGAQTAGQAPVAATKGQPSPTNSPGARANPYFWKDADDNFWLFGGYNGSVNYNSLWKYSPAANTWTWVSGALTTGNVNGVYGTSAGIPGGHPGARNNGFGWADKKGDFYIYGGGGRDAVSTGDVLLNDHWRYNPSQDEWTWMNGSNIGGVRAAVYGNRGVPAITNQPGTRYGYKGWTDAAGNAWIFGGHNGDFFNDVWKYDHISHMWIWMKGGNAYNGFPAIGTMGTPAFPNTPGGVVNSVTWTDNQGNFWVFGGWGYNSSGLFNLNTIWRLAPTLPSSPGQPSAYTVAKRNVCVGESNITYTVPPVPGATSYDWEYSGTNVTLTANTASPANSLSFASNATNGTLRVRAVNGGGNSAWRDTAITVNQLPTVTSTNTGNRSVCAGDSLQLTAGGSSSVSYQWKEGTTNVGTNNASYYAKTAGSYTVTATNTTTNCSATSTPATVLTVNALPAAVSTNTGARSVCAGDSLLLSATTGSGVSYQWKNGAVNVGTGATYYAKAAGSYTVTVMNTTTNCSATSTPATVLTVNALPAAVSTNTGARSVCAGDSLLLSATTGSGVSYQWKNGTTNAGTGATYYAKTAGTYTVTVTNTATNCSATSSPASILTVNPLPAASVTAGGATEVCTGETVVLTAAPVSGVSYQWKQGTTPAGTNINSYTANATGSYKVVVTYTSTGCSDSTVPVDVVVYDRPVVSLVPGDTAFCEGGLVKLEVQSQDTGLTYRWRNGSTAIPLASAYFLEITGTGVYSVVAGRSQVGNCEDSTNKVTVTVHPLPVVDITWDGKTLHATPGHSSYQWHTSGQALAGATDSTFEPSSDGGYSVTVTDGNGCIGVSPVYNATNVSVDYLHALSTQIRVYPNPVTDGMLHIDAPVEMLARIVSPDGRIVWNGVTSTGIIDVSTLVRGLYLLVITAPDGIPVRTEKILMAER